ncbi:DNA-directed RNA polymerases I, II, and III subunit RPABC1, partial [Fragariocoptes setiger]
MDDEAECYKLWRVRKTVLQMCHDRGYLVLQNKLDQTLEQFKEEFGDKPVSANKPTRDELTVDCRRDNDATDRIIVFFAEEPKIGVKTVKALLQRMKDEGISRGIVVIQLSMTPSAKQALTELAPEFVLEHFTESELLINITEHELVPHHQLLTNDEKLQLIAKQKLKETQLMKLLASDPVARYYGYKRGQVIKITRKSDTAGRYVAYRLVI